MKPFPRLRKFLQYAALAGLGLLAAGLLVVFGTGDFGATQCVLNGLETRALAHRSTLLDRLALKALYQALLVVGRVRHPQAAEFLAYYCAGRGDTLRFDAAPLLRHPEVQLALRHHKQAISFRHHAPTQPRHHVVRRTDPDLYYAFDLLFIRQRPGRVVFYDQYYFQPLARRSRTAFRLGRVRFQLNDGLIHVAYPRARPFTTYGEVRTNGR